MSPTQFKNKYVSTRYVPTSFEPYPKMTLVNWCIMWADVSVGSFNPQCMWNVSSQQEKYHEIYIMWATLIGIKI